MMENYEKHIQGKTVLITGGAGAIGWKINRMPGDDDMVKVLQGLADGTIRQKMLKKNGE